MSAIDIDPEKSRRDQDQRIQRQAAAVSGLFQSDVVVVSLLESLVEGVVILDTSGIILLVNSRAEQMFGYRIEALVHTDYSCLFPAEERNTGKPEAELKKAVARKRVEGEGWLIRSDGSRFRASTVLTALHDGSGILQGFALLTHDVTESRRADDALRESETKFFKAFQAAPDLLTISSLEQGKYIEVNEEFERTLKYSRDEVIGRTVQELGIWVNPGDRAEVVRLLREQRKVRDFETRLRARTGQVIDGLLSAELIEIKGEECLVAITKDVTERKRAEEVLRFSEARFRALFRDNPTMIVTLDERLTMLAVNPACASQLGYTVDELLGQSVLKLFRENDRPAVTDQLQTCLRNPEQVYRWQFRKIRKDGQVLWVEETAQAISDVNGALNLLVVCQDITARKQAEEAREQLLGQLDAVLNSIAEGVVIADLSGNILTMNPSALAFHEYESVEQVRRQLSQLLDTFELSGLDGQIVPFDQWPLSRALRGERFVDFEVCVNRKDTGTTRIGSYSGTPVQTRSGDEILAVITVRDITERKQAETEIQRLASFPLMNPNPVLELNADGKVTFSNPAAKQILEKAGDIGIDPFLPENLPAILQDLRGNKAGLFHRDIEVDGRFFEELVYIAPQFQTVRIYTMDITERKRAEAEVERLNADLAARAVELEAFNYTVAHDLRKPLTVVNGYCQALLDLCGSRLDEECKDYLREAYDGTLRMNRLIDALLNFSRMARVELRRETVDCTALAKLAAAELQLAEPQRRVTVRIAEGVQANGDASLLRVALDNLLGNAWKYTGTCEEGLIEFGLTQQDGVPVFFVRDNGLGFAPEHAAKLFLPFTRLPGAECCQGFGIGLATVERIIRRHGGRIWAEGTPGQGATFYFTLGVPEAA